VAAKKADADPPETQAIDSAELRQSSSSRRTSNCKKLNEEPWTVTFL